MKYLFLIVVFTSFLFSQQPSIHQQEWEYYRTHPEMITRSSEPSAPAQLKKEKNIRSLNKVVYGFHPYWMNGMESKYKYSLLTHIAYFSGDVNTANGTFSSTNSWASANVVTQAKLNGVKVHFTFTLFSGHATFMNSPAIRGTFINNLMAQINLRNADGCNVDVEGLPSALADSFRVFIKQLGDSLKSHGKELVVELPAWDWSTGWIVYGTNFFNTTKSVVDYYFLMAYDYSWSGSTAAGPVAPLQSPLVTNWFNCYSSVNTFLAKGCPPEKLIAGFPYYGFDWPTTSNSGTAAATANASSRTYTVVKNNYIDTIPTAQQFWNSTYNTRWYYYNNGTSWRVTWYDDSTSLKLKYDIVKAKNLAGTGMWALGYDGSEPELWNVLQNSFTTSVRNGSATPDQFILEQNYPNPFNPITMINYQLPMNSLVTLNVYDVIGREVATLVNEVQEAGSYTEKFDGSKLSSGIYFYTLRAGKFIATKKLTMMK